jgi:hypothetical protein
MQPTQGRFDVALQRRERRGRGPLAHRSMSAVHEISIRTRLQSIPNPNPNPNPTRVHFGWWDLDVFFLMSSRHARA